MFSLRACLVVTLLLLLTGRWARSQRPEEVVQRLSGSQQARRTDQYGDSLPEGALVRIGTIRFRNPTRAVSTLDFAPDGQTFLSIGRWDRIARVWETATGKERYHFTLPPIADWVLTPDHRLLITSNTGPSIRIWETVSGKLLREFSSKNSQFTCLCLTPDGATLAVAVRDLNTKQRSIRLWDLASGTELRDISLTPSREMDQEFIPDDIFFTGGGKILGAREKYSDNVRVRFWNLATGQEIPIPFENRHRDELPTVSPDGKVLISVARDGKTRMSLRLFDTPTGKLIRQLDMPLSPGVVGIRFSPDSRLVLVVDAANNLFVWDVANGKQQPAPVFSGITIESVAFSVDSKTLAIAESRLVHLCEVATGKQFRDLTTSTPADDLPWQTGIGDSNRLLPDSATVAFSPDGKLLAAPVGEMLRVWEVATGKEICPIRAGHEGSIRALSVSPDGRLVATVSIDATARLWETATGRQVHVLPLPWMGEDIPAQFVEAVGKLCIAFSPDGKTFAAASPFGMVRLWDTATGKKQIQFGIAKSGVTSLAFTRDGRWLVTGGRGEVLCWDPTTGKQLHRLALMDPSNPATGVRDDGGRFLEVAISPDGRLLAATRGKPGFQERPRVATCELYLWELSTGKLRRQIPQELARQRMFAHESADMETNRRYSSGDPLVAFTPDGKTLAWNQGDMIELRDVGGMRPLRLLGDRVDSIAGIAFSPGGGILAVASWDGTLRFYDPATATILGTVAVDDHFYCLAFSPDGRTLITGCGDTTALIWDVSHILEAGLPRVAKPMTKELDALWHQLASSDGTEAATAIERLVALPQHAVPLLREHLHPIAPLDAQRAARLLGDLDNNDFKVRKEANAELETLAELAAPFLRERLTEEQTPEARRRVERLLDNLAGFVIVPSHVQNLRAIEVLEHIGNSEAQTVLRDLSQGARDARQTQEAIASLRRLGERSSRKRE
jgi:WD40 repeat protein